MFERFTERARQAVILAEEEARTLEHGYIGTEHILLGLLREENGLAARVLRSLDISLERSRDTLLQITPQGEDVLPLKLPFTPRSKKVLELALREALSLEHNYVGTEHILLGLVREHEGLAVRILTDSGAPAEKVRNEVIRMLTMPPGGPRPSVTAPSTPQPPDEEGGRTRPTIEARPDEIATVAEQLSLHPADGSLTITVDDNGTLHVEWTSRGVKITLEERRSA